MNTPTLITYALAVLLVILALGENWKVTAAINYIKRYRDVCIVAQEPLGGRYMEFFRTKRALDSRAGDPNQFALAFITRQFQNETGYLAFALVEEGAGAVNSTKFYVMPFGTMQNLTRDNSLSFEVRGDEEGVSLTNVVQYVNSSDPSFATRVGSFTVLSLSTHYKLTKKSKLILFGNYNTSVSMSEIYSGVGLSTPTFLTELDIVGSRMSCMGSHGFFLKYRLYPQQFKRVTVYVSLAIDLVVFLTTLAGVILLRNRKLISARYVTRYVSLALLIVFRVLMSFDYPLVDETVYYVSLSILAVYSISSGMVFYSLESLRYFYIRNVYTIIAKMEDNSVTAAESASKLSIHRKLISTPAVLVLLAVIMGTLLFPVFLYHIPVWVNVRNPIAYSTLDAIENAAFVLVCFMPAVTCAIGALSFFIEFLINIPLIRKRGLSWYISFDDPLLVRSEVLIFSVVALPLLISAGGVFFSLLLQSISLPPCPGPNCITVKGLVNLLTTGLILSPTSWALSFTMGGGFAVLVELFRIGKCAAPAPTVDHLGTVGVGEELSELKTVLDNREAYELFEQYCTRELSVENLKLWNRLATNARMSQSMELEDFRKLYQQFIAQSSPFQVNIASDTQKKLQGLLNNPGKIAWTDLKPLFLDVMHNLNDTFRRFRTTNEFNRFKTRMGLKESLMITNYKIAELAEQPTNQTSPRSP